MENLMQVDTSKLNKAELLEYCNSLKAGLSNMAQQGTKPLKYTNCRSVTFQANQAEMPSEDAPEIMEQLRNLNAIKQYAQLVEEWKSAKVQVTDRWGNVRNVKRVRTYEEIDILETEQELKARLETAVATRDPKHPKYEKDAAPGQGCGTSHKIYHLNESLDQFKPDDKHSGFKAPTCFGTNVQQIPHEQYEELIQRNPESKKQRMHAHIVMQEEKVA